MKIVLHIGMPKCGSTSLQKYFCTPLFTEAAALKRIAYICIDKNGGLLFGDELQKHSEFLIHGSIVSCSGRDISAFDRARKKEVLNKILLLNKNFDTVIISNEGYGINPDHLQDDCIFKNRKLDVTVLAYIRPQIEWLNSAWWQWGAWTNVPFNRWINLNLRKANWFSLIEKWKRKSWVKAVDVRLLTGNIIEDISSYFGILSNDVSLNINKSLPAEVLRLYQLNRSLRPGPHSSEIDFIVSRHITDIYSPTPWVIPRRLLKKFLTFYEEQNLKLLAMLPKNMQDSMMQDKRWWSHEFYSSANVSRPTIKDLRNIDLQPLTVQLIEALVKLEKENRDLKQLYVRQQGTHLVIPPQVN